MTAKEMFEALGYHLHINDRLEVCYDKFCDSVHEQITFWLKNREYNSCFFDGEEIDIRDITLEEHKAIHQQLKELGWIND